MPSASDPTPASLDRARAHLVEPKQSEPTLGALAAAGLAAIASLTLAASVILGPFWVVNSPPAAANSGHPPY